MKPTSIPAGLVLVAVLLISVGLTPTVHAETATERFEQTVDVTAGVEITLRNTNGKVEIRTWDHDAVEIVAEKRVRVRDRDASQEALEAIEIQIDRSNGKLDIRTELPRDSSGVVAWLFGRHVEASVSYELRIPASAHLDVVTVNGSVLSSGPEGEQRLRSTNGRITVERAHGAVDARTTNGSIDVELSEALSQANINVSTTNGSITVHIPADLKGTLEARTVNGTVRTEIPVTLHGSNSKRRMNADLNCGGAAYIGLTTTNGSIRILES